MNKKEAEVLSDQLVMADALIRLKALENLLISKGIITNEEFQSEMDVVTRSIAKTLLERANVGGNLDELIDSLATPKAEN